jgi:hypothetical protein
MKRINLKIEEWATGFRSIANISVRVLVMAFAVSLFAVSCGKDDDGDGGDDSGGNGNVSGGLMPTAKGQLTVNGLSAYDGKHTHASGVTYDEDDQLYFTGVRDITVSNSSAVYHIVKIESGSAKIPLYYNDDGATDVRNAYKAYEGNSKDSRLMVAIQSSSSYTMGGTEPTLAVKWFKVRFTNGSATVNWSTDGHDANDFDDDDDE